MAPRLEPRRIPAKDLLRLTWNKAWTKQWVQANTPFAVPRSIVYAESWAGICKWLEGPSCPVEQWFILKPLNLSQSRGVMLLWKEIDGSFLKDSQVKRLELPEVLACIVTELPRTPNSYKWLVEKYISPPPLELKLVEYDWPFNPLVRIIMYRGDFHFGELHIPTRASQGRGSLKGGARRICFNYRGELLQTRPDIPNDLPWSIENYGTVNDVTGITLPHFTELVADIKTYVCKPMAPHALFAFDGCYQVVNGQTRFVCIEIEHAPNVRHLARFDGLREPSNVA